MPTAEAKWPQSHRLKAARELAGLSVIELAEKTGSGLGRGPIQEVERGKRQLSGSEAARIARVCGVSPAFFYVDFKDGIAKLAELPVDADPVDFMDAVQAKIDEARREGLT